MQTAAAKALATRGITVAMIGNPNTGKTSLFNDLTGLRQRVGNYPGITVEKKVGALKLEGCEATLIDLPGAYSLSAASPDERIVFDVLGGRIAGMKQPDAVLCVVDGTNLMRNLFLASQVAELDMPMVIAINLWDAAEKEGIAIDVEKLSKRLGVPVVPTIATRGVGSGEIRRALREAIEGKARMVRFHWPAAVREAVRRLGEGILKEGGERLTETELQRILFDADSALLERTGWRNGRGRKIVEAARGIIREAGYNPMAAEALLKYDHLGKLLEGIVKRGEGKGAKTTESIDKLMLHRGWGLVIFTGLMYLVFQSVYAWANPFMDAIEGAKNGFQASVVGLFPDMPILRSLVRDGIIEGVGAFLVFLPQIVILFFFIALLEDTGYMARAAFLMDKIFSWCGLNGKSFVPMLSSYACAVPGIMATRTIEDPKARLTTILVAPLMSCSARLPVYVLLIGAFVEPVHGPWWAGFTLFILHFVGLAVAIPVALILNRFVLKIKPQPFLLELPAYRVPRLRNLAFRMWESGQEFMVRAGTIIFSITIMVWALLYFPRPPALEEAVRETYRAEMVSAGGWTETALREALERGDSSPAKEVEERIASAYINQSLMGRLGKTLQPFFSPCGFDWKLTVGVLASFPAREVIIPTLGVIYSLGGEVNEESGDLRAALRGAVWAEGGKAGSPVYTMPAVLALMVFFALCSQCASTLSVIAKETNWKWSLFAFTYMTFLAWVGAGMVYQIGAFFF